MNKALLIIFIFSLNFTFAQKIFENKQYRFSIQEPSNWIEAKNNEILKNLEKYKINDENLSKIISENKGSILLTSFYKYDPKTRSGLIPTIQINVRSRNGNNFETFKNSIIEGANGFKNYFEDFEFIDKPKEIKISGINCMYFVGKFTMKTQNGQELKVRSRTYAIPYKNYFFQINFTDGQDGEDCSTEFDQLVKSIKVGE